MKTIYDNAKVMAGIFLLLWLGGDILFLIFTDKNPERLLLFLLRLSLLIIMAAAAEKFVVRKLKKTEKAIDDYVSQRIELEQLGSACPITEGYAKLLKYLAASDNKKEMLKYSIEQSKLIALQNQINPHFLYNTLDAIRGDALDADQTEIASITEALASFFHYSISDLDRLATLEQELENVKEYFRIQQFRFGENLKLEIICEGDMEEVRKYCVPRMTLQPIVENAISHGLECKEKRGTICIFIIRSQYELIIKVTDDGIGMDKQDVDTINEALHSPGTYRLKREGRGGIALTNISSRIRLIFGVEYGITIFSCRNIGTTVQINVPLVERNGQDEEGIAEDREWSIYSE